MVINPIIYDSKSGRAEDIFSSNLSKRIVHLVGEINEQMAAAVVGQLLYLDSLNHETISLYIYSPGGEVSSGLAILDTMNFIESPVSTVCLGMAASMGAVLFSAGEKGHRYVLPHSEVMVHQPMGGSNGQASDILIAADHIKRTRNTLAEILADNCSRAVDEVMQDLDRDKWMNAKEAVEYGIADGIIDRKTE